jgi:hypothetical protein
VSVPVATARGKRSPSRRTHPGAYVDAAFLNAPNQMSTRRSPRARAASTCASTVLKSKVPSAGSTCAQLAAPITVRMPMPASRSQIGSMYSGLDGLELCS